MLLFYEAICNTKCSRRVRHLGPTRKVSEIRTLARPEGQEFEATLSPSHAVCATHPLISNRTPPPPSPSSSAVDKGVMMAPPASGGRHHHHYGAGNILNNPVMSARDVVTAAGDRRARPGLAIMAAVM